MFIAQLLCITQIESQNYQMLLGFNANYMAHLFFCSLYLFELLFYLTTTVLIYFSEYWPTFQVNLYSHYFWDFQKKGPKPKFTIYKHVSDKSEKCLSVGSYMEFYLLIGYPQRLLKEWHKLYCSFLKWITFVLLKLCIP